MRFLVDTQSIIWYVDDYQKLSTNALATLNDQNNDLYISIASIWEIGIKYSLGKLPLSMPYVTWMVQAMQDMALIELPITINYVAYQAGLHFHHRDPFDRMLVAQAIVERIPIVSNDSHLDAYGIPRIW